MTKFNRTNLGLALVTVAALCGMAQEVAAKDSPLAFTVYVINYARVDARTLVDAESAAAVVFHKSGVNVHWVTSFDASKEIPEEASGPGASRISHLYLSILSKAMSDRMGLPDRSMGLAPGNGVNRQHIYIFYSKVEALAQNPICETIAGNQYFSLVESLILGHAIAHEIGHVLLNLEIHTDSGIMHGSWDMNELREMAKGRLGFSKQQREDIRIEVARRMGRQEDLQTTGIEMASAAR